MIPNGADGSEKIGRWTADQLYVFFSAMLEERDKRYDDRFRSQETAVTTANVAMQRRLDLLNEFRAQAADEQAHFARKDEVALKIDAATREMALRLEAVTRDVKEGFDGFAEQRAMSRKAIFGTCITVAGLSISLAYVLVSVFHP